MILTLQREVANRICSDPGDMSLLALSVQVFGRPYVVGQIPAGAFYPIPKVNSSILRVDIYDNPVIPYEKLDKFFQLIKAGFGQKRKTLRNALAHAIGLRPEKVENLLNALEINPQRRAETLSLVEWRSIVELYAEDQY
jgi:16S rRNA (adenine1518-N6/adenine1519-N6)-dimethyltransferase